MNLTLPTYFLYILLGQQLNAPVLIFPLNSLREVEFFNELGKRSHNLKARKDSLSRGKQYDLLFFLMYNRFLNYKVFPQNERYHFSIQVILLF